VAAAPQFDAQPLVVLRIQQGCNGSGQPCERMRHLIVVFRLLRGLFGPWELRRLMRRMPTTPRLWVQTESGIRPETDADYLMRLRERAREKASRSAARRSTATRRSHV
jgi:hypothetical protein